MRTQPWLIQRIEESKYVGKDSKGVDKSFSFDYMGSSEFEWGALPKALKEMRAAGFEKLSPRKMVCGENSEYVIWFIGPESVVEIAKRLIDEEMSSHVPHTSPSLKERMSMKESYTRKDWAGRESTYADRYIGWWCIDEGIEFLLFKKKEHANLWQQLMVK